MASLGKKILVYGLCSMLASPFMVLPKQSYAQTPANLTVFSGGTIYTMTESLEEVQNNETPHRAMVVVVNNDTGKIERVFKDGKETEAAEYLNNKNYKQVDLGNNVMLPGFIDPHGHFPAAPDYSGINLAPSPIGDVDTIEQVQARLLEKIQERKYAEKGINYVTATNYDDTLLDVQRHPYHEELSKGELGNFYIEITHISGHLLTINTKALKRFFEESYYNSPEFKEGVKLHKDDTVTKAELVNNNGVINYQLTYTPVGGGEAEIKQLPGILMRGDAVDTFNNNDKTVDTFLKCMTGTFVEQAMTYVVQLPTDETYKPDAAETMALASKEYASRGVTTSMQGAALLPQALPAAQQGLLSNKLKIRTIIQPMVYNALDAEITPMSIMNHTALAWEKINTTAPDDADRNIGNPKEGLSPKAGDDISTWYPGELNLAGYGAGPGSANQGTPAYDVYQKQQSGELPKDMIFLGSWKMIYDGSNQGYTGYFGQNGYYQLPDGNVTFFPIGRTGSETEGNVVINNLGMTSIDDPKNFVKAGNHYGNQGCFYLPDAQDVFQTGVTTFKRYHEKGQSIHCHMNGSRASSDGVTFIEMAVAAAAKAGKDIKDSRHTIIHAQMQELVETQRLLGNYNQYPLRAGQDEQALQDICTVWQGTAGMTWVPGEQITKDYNGYDPEEGHYDTAFSAEALQLRKDLQNGQLMKDQNFISSYFVDHTYYWGQRHRDIFMGPGSAYNMSPMGWAVQLGHRWTLHNDSPITPQNPLKSVSIATTRLSSGYTAGGVKGPQEPIYHVGAGKNIEDTKEYYPTKIAEQNNGEKRKYVYFDQRITVLQALHALTVNSAWETKGLETKLGQIKEGFYADFVILAQDPFELEKQGEAGLLKIADIPVVATLVGGETVFGVLPDTEEGNFVSNLEASFFKAATVNNISEENDDLTAPVTEDAIAEAAKGITGSTGVYLGYKQFKADIGTNSDVAIFSMQIMGNNDVVENIKLHKFINNSQIEPFAFIESGFDKDQVDTYAGKYWITDRTLEKPLEKGAVLQAGQAYYIHFAVEDDSNFDLNNTADVIQDPVIVTANAEPQVPTANAPADGGSSSSGCTVGTNSQYDLVVVFFAALGILAVRVLRRRENA